MLQFVEDEQSSFGINIPLMEFRYLDLSKPKWLKNLRIINFYYLTIVLTKWSAPDDELFFLDELQHVCSCELQSLATETIGIISI